jgi:hypothetical protein
VDRPDRLPRRRAAGGTAVVIETFVLLLAAHLIADFPLQPDWLVARKRELPLLAAHTVFVAVLAVLFLGTLHWPLLAILAGSHLLMDAVKVYLLSDRLRDFLLDQGVHLAVIVGLAIAFPHVWEAGWLGALSSGRLACCMIAVVLASGVVATLQPGAIIIRKATAGFAGEIARDIAGLPDGGRYIGYLERLLILLLIIAGQAAGVGFLLTAKSILRFGDVKESSQRKMTEYIIIGTFMSFGWGMLVALLTRAGIDYWLPGVAAS